MYEITLNYIFTLPHDQDIQSLSFLTFHIFVLSSKFLCFWKALETYKVSLSEEITAGQKSWRSNFAQHIIWNFIFWLPEVQPTQYLSFFIFDIFVFPSKLLCFRKILEASKASPSEEITVKQKIWRFNFAQNIIWIDIFWLPKAQPTKFSSFWFWTFLTYIQIFYASGRL